MWGIHSSTLGVRRIRASPGTASVYRCWGRVSSTVRLGQRSTTTATTRTRSTAAARPARRKASSREALQQEAWVSSCATWPSTSPMRLRLQPTECTLSCTPRQRTHGTLTATQMPSQTAKEQTGRTPVRKVWQRATTSCSCFRMWPRTKQPCLIWQAQWTAGSFSSWQHHSTTATAASWVSALSRSRPSSRSRSATTESTAPCVLWRTSSATTNVCSTSGLVLRTTATSVGSTKVVRARPSRGSSLAGTGGPATAGSRSTSYGCSSCVARLGRSFLMLRRWHAIRKMCRWCIWVALIAALRLCSTGRTLRTGQVRCTDMDNRPGRATPRLASTATWRVWRRTTT